MVGRRKKIKVNMLALLFYLLKAIEMVFYSIVAQLR